MLLCLDVGNSQICGGVFNQDELILRFRHSNHLNITSDQLGVFLKLVLKENGIDPNKIKNIAACSVVPSIDYSLKAACIKYFAINPFMINSHIKMGLTIDIKNPEESGADLIAGAIAASYIYPEQDLMVIDLGTATTISAVTADQKFLGATFIPGIKTALNSLDKNTAKLFSVEITCPKLALGRTTTESIQAGLYFGQLGSIKEIVNNIKQEVFSTKNPKLIATGGFAYLFENEKLFDHIEPNLVLKGIKLSFEENKND